MRVRTLLGLTLVAPALIGVIGITTSQAARRPAGAEAGIHALSEADIHASSEAGIHKIKHVVMIVQENRSFDNYFGTYPGADGLPRRHGRFTVCVPDPKNRRCVRPYHDRADVNGGGPHDAQSSAVDVNGGRMNGFIREREGRGNGADVQGLGCQGTDIQDNPVCSTGPDDVMGYHNGRDIPNYWTYARDFVLQDHMFEPVASWSLPAHLYEVSAWSAQCSVPLSPASCRNNATAYTGPFDTGIATGSAETWPAVHYDWTDLTYLLHRAHVSWRYYLDQGAQPDCADGGMVCPPVPQATGVPGIWNPLPAFDTVQQDRQVNDVVPLKSLFADAAHGRLPAVSWVMPNNTDSEHPPSRVSTGQAYVTRIVDAIMRSKDWSSTAIFVTWDDWGGFYDHVAPAKADANGYGIRVPGLVISPYAKTGYIDRQILSFDAYLKFIEDDFLRGQRLDPRTDGRPDPRPDVRENASILGSLAADFNFAQRPRPPLLLPLHPHTDLTG
jgi:phospholipase C